MAIRRYWPQSAESAGREILPRPPRPERIHSLQALRAIAALLVLWSHSIDGAELFSVPHQSRFFHWEHFGTCGVDIFFVISGFIVSLVAERSGRGGGGERVVRPRHFLTRRITRVFPLYWITTGVIILEGALARHGNEWQKVKWIPTLFLLPDTHYPTGAPILALGWTLMFEMYFYFILAFFLFISPRAVVRNAVVFLVSAVLIGALVGIERPWLVVGLNPMLLEFVFGCALGVLFHRTRDQAAAWWRPGAALAAIGAVALISTIFAGYGSANDAFHILAGQDCWLRVGVWGVPSALLVGGMLLWNPSMRSPAAQLLVFLGDASFSLYLCTMAARSVVDHFWRAFGMFGADAGVLLGVIFCTLVGIGCYLLIERPLMRAFHNWYKPLHYSLPVRSA